MKRAAIVALALVACGEAEIEHEIVHEVEDVIADDVDDVIADEVEDVIVHEVETETTLPLDDTPGLAVELVAIALGPDAPGPLAFIAEVTADGLDYPIGDGPTLYKVPAPGDAEPRTAFVETPFVLTPGERRAVSRLIAWAPGATTLDLALSARTADGPLLSGSVRVAAGSPSRLDLRGAGLTLTLAARTGAPPLRPDTRIGLTLDGALAAADLAERVPGTLAVKHYAGARRWLLRPHCDSDEACAEGGASWPCVSRCACACDEARCDCDFSALEPTMQDEALATARRLVGDAANALARVRLHWVFKRSLGGTASCDVSGELDVSPATWRRFFAEATRAAIAINERLGFRLIDVLSPMNEANHPLQDGAHVNAAGQPTVGGLISFADVIGRTSCAAGRCCTPDRYIVASPDVPALSAAALLGAMEPLSRADPALAPEVALSLYLDVEQTDPLQADGAGLHPSIVTPVAGFMTALRDALADEGRADAIADEAFPAALLVADTYPGSWGAPWFETADAIVHHMDPSTRRIVRVDPVAAADAAIARALAAADDFSAVVGTRPRVLLGEVGWSTFDGDEQAQARFARRLFDAAAWRQGVDPAFAGFLWFKTKDRSAFAYPTWEAAPSPLDGSMITCDTRLLGPIACAADVLAAMESQWGLARHDGTRKPAWEALIGRWARGAELGISGR